MFLMIAERGDPNALSEAGDESFVSLTDLRKRLESAHHGNDVYVLKDAEGLQHRFTFAPWANQNPDATFLQLAFRKYNPHCYGAGKPLPLPPKGVYEF